MVWKKVKAHRKGGCFEVNLTQKLYKASTNQDR